MKKFTFVLMLMLAYAGFTVAQTIEDFESIKMYAFDQGANGLVTIVPNPDATGANTSLYVGKMIRGKDGQPWAGWYSLSNTVNITTNRYVHIKVWKPRISPTDFKVENGPVAEFKESGDVYPMVEYSNVGHWEELVWDMTTAPNAIQGEYPKITFIPDFKTPVGLDNDIIIYFDDIYFNNDPAVGSAPVQLIENFETIPLNYMLNGDTDNSSMELIANPDKTGVNLSDWVIKFNRDKDGSPWDGFWSNISEYSQPLDLTTNKYVHVKVWKPRISPVWFKIQDGSGVPATLEQPSASPQTKTGQWEDIVWDFSAMPATTYPIIGLQPDREDPVTLVDDIIMYFDDIKLNNDPNPILPPKEIIQVDMNGATLVAGDKIWITGNFGGIYGSWATPGDNANNELTDPDGDGIYTIELSVAYGTYEFKFFINAGWDPINPGKDPYGVNRIVAFTEDCNNIYTWGVGGVETSIRDNKQAGKILMYPNPVRNELTVNTTSNISKVIITNTLGKVVGNTIYSKKTINTSTLSKGMYFVTFVNADGTKSTQKLIKD